MDSSPKAWHLVLLQDVAIGVNGTCPYAPVVVWARVSYETYELYLLMYDDWLSEWFVQRRALAASLIFGDSGIDTPCNSLTHLGSELEF